MVFTDLLLFLLGMTAFAFSTVSGGGGALLLTATAHHFIPADRMAQTIHLGNFLGRPSRVVLFWKHVHWPVIWRYVPAAWLGGWLGVRLFVEMEVSWIRIVLAAFLLTTPLQYQFGKLRRSFQVELWWFAPLGFLISTVSSLTGATGSVLNVFYLNYGLSKEGLVGTKAVNAFLVAIVQLSAYGYYGAWSAEIWRNGLVLGAGALIGNVIGKRLLKGLTDQRFRQMAVAVMFLSGVYLLYAAA